ncbi:MAG TPA: hypothetical protein VJP79_10480 [Nitrososphaera sp.]|nr:hypothetical protein [Nitrososphaera sp.]
MRKQAEKMDESSSQKKTKTIDAVIAAVNLAAMGVALSSKAEEKMFEGDDNNRGSSDKREAVEKRLDELAEKLDRISEQLKVLQGPQQEQQKVVAVAASTTTTTTATATGAVDGADKQPENAGTQQAKPQDVIYVRKSSEFSFYS